jgi:hypothetical protein
MTDPRDDVLAQRFAALAVGGDGLDWDEVQRRARGRRPSRAVLAVVATALVVVLAAPALALRGSIVNFFEAERAPERVQLEFASLDVGAPPGMEQGAVAGEARKVMTVTLTGKRHTLWVTPSKKGFCHLWTGWAGGCTQPDELRRLEPHRDGDVHPGLVGLSYHVDHGIPVDVGGVLLAPGTDRAVAEFRDGTREEIPFQWVSAPIDAGFFLFEVPAGHLRTGAELVSVSAEDGSGNLLGRSTIPILDPVERVTLPDGTAVELPANVDVSKARRPIDFTAENGRRVTLWILPRHGGGVCFAAPTQSGCRLPDQEFPRAIVAGIHGGGPPLLYAGQTREDVARLELRYEDGAVESVEPVEGFVLHEIRSSHFPRGSRLELVTAFDEHGVEVDSVRVDPATPGIYPCTKSERIDRGHGVMACP